MRIHLAFFVRHFNSIVFFVRIQQQVVDPYQKIVSRTAQLRRLQVKIQMGSGGCISMHISAYITYKSLAVCKIMEAMHTAYAKSGNRPQHVSNCTCEADYHRRHASNMTGKRTSFVNNRCTTWNMHSFLYFFSLVLICEFLCTNFLSACIQCLHLFKS